MKKICILFLCCALLLSLAAPPAFAEKQNDYPLVFVHGLFGWGRDEALGIKYWGGLRDIQEDLNRNGFQAYTAAVGPVSSNWDRACELYAYIKGGTVDYGKVHSARNGHARYGRTFPGLYSQWGTLDSEGKIKKVHLVGHSMGGQTVRVLTQLLAQGNEEEINGTPPGELSPLFKGGSNWISSATTISSPHDGSPLAIGLTKLVPCIRQMVEGIAALNGVATDNLVYDFKLDQWGLKRLPEESFDAYFDRVFNSNVWENSKDIASWDLDPDGAKELNSWVKAQPDVYYFSWSTEATFKELFTGHEVPEISMNPIFSASSLYMGAYTRNQPGHVVIDSKWWKNDGAASTIAMNGPKIGSTDTIVEFNGTPQVGRWNHMGVLNSYDHTDIIGLFTVWNPTDWYRSLAFRLASLPKND